MSEIPQEVVELFAMLGMSIAGLIAIFAIYGLFLWLKDQIIFWCKRYKDKHFAEKCPKPPCHCVQCEYWHASETSRETGLCCVWEKWTSANELCARGYLRTRKGYEDEEWRIENWKN